MFTTDFLQLNQTAMFAKIRDSLPIEKHRTQNLLTSKDDLLYAWDAKESSILVLHWRIFNDNKVQKQQQSSSNDSINTLEYQILMPAVHITFDVEHIECSNQGSLVALAGPRGICVLELPPRWGSKGLYHEGKTRITCRSHNLDVQLFNNNPHLHLRQLRWHYASPTDSHLLLLLSDNTIRVYDNCILLHVWQVGPLPLRNDANHNSSTVYALGEAVVDFDIAPATSPFDSNELTINASSTLNTTNQTSIRSNKGKIEWPLVILRKNGNIYILMTGLDTERPRLQGPLTISPPQTDNYGLDSCSLLIIPSLPPTLVIAETNGKLHHALLIEAENVENSFNEVDENLIIHPSEWMVHVLETVELELGLHNESTNPKMYYCPIHLKRDYWNELRYFAYHNTGLHVITVNFAGELQRFLKNSVNSDITSLISTSSQAEYILCTKIESNSTDGDTGTSVNKTGDGTIDYRVNAVLGFAVMQKPSSVVLLLSSGQVISLKLIMNIKLLFEPDFLEPEFKKKQPVKQRSQQNRIIYYLPQMELAEILNSNFVDFIKQLLRRETTQPILSLDKNGNVPTPTQCFELLVQAMQVLRSQYLEKHDLVRNEILQRVNIIKFLVEHQKLAVGDLDKERQLIQDKAHKLAEKFEKLSDQQESLTKRCRELMREAQTRLPNTAIAHNKFNKEVEHLNEMTRKMQINLQKLKDTMKKQNYHIAKYQESDKKKQYELPEVQERTIKGILLQMNTEIDVQIKEVKSINRALNP